jgi:hypothetical protein
LQSNKKFGILIKIIDLGDDTMKQHARILRFSALFILLCFLLGCTPPHTPPATDPNPPTAGCPHIDANDDGDCDDCGITVLIALDLYAINDLHGKFADGDTHPGVDELTTYLKAAIAADDSAILLSSGDTWQGSSESNLTRGLILTDWMNE